MSNASTATFSTPSSNWGKATHICIFGRNPEWRWWKFWVKKEIFYSAPLKMDFNITKKWDGDISSIIIKEE